MNVKTLASHLNATDLAIGQTPEQVTAFVEEAVCLGLRGVCVYPNMVETALAAAKGRIVVGTVTGFPSGIDVPATKIGDAALSVRLGARELDFGVNLSALKSGDTDTLEEEISGIIAAARPAGCRVYAVFNTYRLSDEEIAALAGLCRKLGVDGLKTTSGDPVIPRQTQPKDAALLKKNAPDLLVKAEGQLDTLEDALNLLSAGADFICSDKAAQILRQAQEAEKGGNAE